MTFEFVDISNFILLGFDTGLLFMEVLLFCSSVFLMLLILVQRGKGGGLTGALGGMGGQSAFGSKAGDAFTKITIITSIIWITLCMITIAWKNPPPRAAKAPVDQTQEQDSSESSMSATGDSGPADGTTDEGAATGEDVDSSNDDATLPGDTTDGVLGDGEFKLDETPAEGSGTPEGTDDNTSGSGN